MKKTLLIFVIFTLLFTSCGTKQVDEDLHEISVMATATPTPTDVLVETEIFEADEPAEAVYPINKYGTVLSDGSIAFVRYYHESTRRYDEEFGIWYEDDYHYTSEVYLLKDGVEQLLYTFDEAKIWYIFSDKFDNIYCYVANHIEDDIPLNQLVSVEQDKYTVILDFSDMVYGSVDLWVAVESGIYYVGGPRTSIAYKYDFETNQTTELFVADEEISCGENTFYCSFIFEGQKYIFYDIQDITKSIKRQGEKGRYKVSLDNQYAITYNSDTGEYKIHSVEDSSYVSLDFDEEKAGFELYNLQASKKQIDNFYVGKDKIYYFVPEIDDKNYTTLKLYTSELDGSNVVEDVNFYIESVQVEYTSDVMRCLYPVLLDDVIYFFASTADEKSYKLYGYHLETNELELIKTGKSSDNSRQYLELMGDQVYFYDIDRTNDVVNLEYIIDPDLLDEQE